MNTSRPSFLWPRQLLLRLRAAGWPVWLGVGAGAVGLLMLVAAQYMAQQARQIAQASHVSSSKPDSGKSVVGPAIASTDFASTLPAQRTHLDDMHRLFKQAKDSGVSVGSIVYRTEGSSAVPVVVRTLDLRLNEDYPRFKGFVAALLASMPHAALQEIRIERKDAAASQQQVLLKLSFFYQGEAKAAVPVAAATAPANTRGSLP